MITVVINSSIKRPHSSSIYNPSQPKPSAIQHFLLESYHRSCTRSILSVRTKVVLTKYRAFEGAPLGKSYYSQPLGSLLDVPDTAWSSCELYTHLVEIPVGLPFGQSSTRGLRVLEMYQW